MNFYELEKAHAQEARQRSDADRVEVQSELDRVIAEATRLYQQYIDNSFSARSS